MKQMNHTHARIAKFKSELSDEMNLVTWLIKLLVLITPYASKVRTGQSPFRSVVPIFIWMLGAVGFAINASAQSCSGGTTTNSSAIVVGTSTSYFTASNSSCFDNTLTGNISYSVTPPASGVIAIANGVAGVEVTNDGIISSINGRSVIRNGGSINLIQNSGNITGNSLGSYGILNYDYAVPTHYGTIQTISNTATGSISGYSNGINNYGATIQTITNMGAIYSTGGGSTRGIENTAGSIQTLNNAQGGNNSSAPTTALTMNGVLPVNYSIIINSATHYGQLVAYNSTGSMNLSISSLSSTGSSVLGTYSTVLNGVTNTAMGISGTSRMGAISNGYTYNLIETGSGTNIWDLTILAYPQSGPSASDTQASLAQSAAALRAVYNQQSAALNNSLNYDCTAFAANDICVSGGGRVAKNDNISGSPTSTLLVAAYKALSNLRVGAFVDQNVPTANVSGINMNKSPMYGVFGVWNENPDGMGYEARLSTGWSNQNITQTRSVVGSSEAGVGSASLVSQAISGVVSYAMPVTDSSWIASPYAGIRKTKLNRGGYTETSAVTTPLTYSDLKQDITTALAGVRMSKKFGDDLYFTGSVGVEQNIGSSISTLDATGVSGLTSTDFSANYAKTRPVASVGVSYAVSKDQRVSFGAMYRKEPFLSAGSTTAMLMYQVGL